MDRSNCQLIKQLASEKAHLLDVTRHLQHQLQRPARCGANNLYALELVFGVEIPLLWAFSSLYLWIDII